VPASIAAVKWAFGIVAVVVTGVVAAFAIYTFRPQNDRAPASPTEVAETTQATTTTESVAPVDPQGRIGFTRVDGQLYLLSLADSTLARVRGDTPFGWASWSRDGRVVAFVALERESQFSTLYVARGGDGANPRPIQVTAPAVGYVAVDPDGFELALLYSLSDTQIAWDLAMATEAGGVTQVLTETGDLEGQPAFSGRGEIAFTRDVSLNTEVGRIYVVGEDGRDERFVVRGADPDWSPDGTQLTYAAPDRQIWRIDIGSGESELVADNGREPSWSPDGNWIAFRRETSDCSVAGCLERIYIVPADGGGDAQPVGPKILGLGSVTWVR
jgi:Tol biopolymer transport system component